MIAGVSFNGKHCYDDMGMILAQKKIGMPTPQTNYITVPGMDGVLDLSTALTGKIKYGTRQLEFTFVTCDHISNRSNWAAFLSNIAKDIHGQEVTIILDDDQNYYYRGRCEIDSFATDWGKQTVKINCTCDPYKYSTQSSGAPWLWDPFSFIDGVIYKNEITVEGEITQIFVGGANSITPEFVCSSNMTVVYMGISYSLKTGSNTIYEISFDPNVETELTFIGNGTVNVLYEVGVL